MTLPAPAVMPANAAMLREAAKHADDAAEQHWHDWSQAYHDKSVAPRLRALADLLDALTPECVDVVHSALTTSRAMWALDERSAFARERVARIDAALAAITQLR